MKAKRTKTGVLIGNPPTIPRDGKPAGPAPIQGEPMDIELLPLSMMRVCPKCAATTGHASKPEIRFCRGVRGTEQYKLEPCKLGIVRPHHHRRCGRCFYEWQEQLDREDEVEEHESELSKQGVMLDPFCEQWRCDACGLVGDYPALQLAYCPGTAEQTVQRKIHCPWTLPEEHLHQACPLCSYTWPVAVIPPG